MSISLAGTVSGTPEYMSPEQVQGEAVDARADIYSLGLLMYELLTGRPVVQCNTPMACMYAHLHNTPAPFSKVNTFHPVSTGLEVVVMKMLAKDPNDRFQSISELMPVLSDFLLQEVTKRKSDPPLGAGSLNSQLPPKFFNPLNASSNKLESATSTSTDELQMLTNLAELYEERGEPEQATAAYRKIASIHIDEDDYKAATNVLMAGLALSPNDDASRRLIETCFTILDKKKTSDAPDGVGISSVPPPQVDVTDDSITAETEKKILAAKLERAVYTDDVREALSIIRNTLVEDPTNAIAMKYAGHIYENVEDDVLDPDEAIWLKALLGKVTGKSSKRPSFAGRDTQQENIHNLVAIAGGKFDSVFGGTFEVPSFEMQKFPVTNKAYKAFIQASGELPPAHWLGSEPPKNALDAPVVGVTLEDARAYAEWCGLRLPTTVEWEAAVRLPDGRQFPWGDEWNSEYCHCSQNGATEPGAVGKYTAGASHFGCLDLIGNVWEWTEPHEGMTSPEPGYFWVMGGSFRHPCVKNGKIARTGVSEMGAYPYLGFRCVRSLQRTRK
jgi:formylglycine-generating enzyme required for sulfatase activity